ncbi:MAG: DUF1800 domain-containing protein [Opitutaceae bacterium]|jgi:uncharacterized protein (DUF1800 family)|nr:DUF1800 domain-containing protein [Opitutaceae bacterium]
MEATTPLRATAPASASATASASAPASAPAPAPAPATTTPPSSTASTANARAPSRVPSRAPSRATPAASDAWQPLPAAQWNASAARHLLRRAAWSAQPGDVARAVSEGLPATLDRLFPENPTPFPLPAAITKLNQDIPGFTARQRAATTPDEKRAIQKERREREQQAQQDMTIKWLQFAARPELSAQEKWTVFLGDIYVVSFEKVRNPAHIHLHHAILRQNGLGPAPALAKAVSRSPAMIRYLDLQESKKDAPNENFARELFELFTLGEGNYTEQDIKQAARAFTGYRIAARPAASAASAATATGPAAPTAPAASAARASTARAAAQKAGARRAGAGETSFVYDPRQHDTGPKTVFGHTGNYDGDDIIDLVYKQPAASVFIPRELARFYLTDAPLPREYLDTLADWWRAQNHDLRALAHRFFGSRLFYSPAHAGNHIKSPFQFYLGLLQDLRLDVAPIPRQTISPLRLMGQMPFQPPNVRGWVGGRGWINSATLAARRQLVQNLFTPFKESNLNADEQVALADARAAGRDRFTIDAARLRRFAQTPPAEVAAIFLKTFIPDAGAQSPACRAACRDAVIKHITGDGKPAQHHLRVRDTAIALLQSPGYQLC